MQCMFIMYVARLSTFYLYRHPLASVYTSFQSFSDFLKLLIICCCNSAAVTLYFTCVGSKILISYISVHSFIFLISLFRWHVITCSCKTHLWQYFCQFDLKKDLTYSEWTVKCITLLQATYTKVIKVSVPMRSMITALVLHSFLLKG